MNLRTVFVLPLIAATGAFAQKPQQPFQAPAVMIKTESSTFLQRIWVVKATKTAIEYRETEIATTTKSINLSDLASLYLYEPSVYAEAMDLYQNREYKKAREIFTKIKETWKPVATLENNPSTLAAFYEMECLRKEGDLDGLMAAFGDFNKSSLTRENQLRQVELYLLWDAVRGAKWPTVLKLVEERAKTRLPGDQRAQVAYCQGLALEATEKPDEALVAFHTAMIADSAASEELSRQAALKVIAFLHAKPEVKRAIQIWGTPEENTNSPGYNQLIEAASIARLYGISLGGGQPLPEEFAKLPEFRPKDVEQPRAKPAAPEEVE
jgi:tetratricopeptide (TPR) repeat protein